MPRQTSDDLEFIDLTLNTIHRHNFHNVLISKPKQKNFLLQGQHDMKWSVKLG